MTLRRIVTEEYGVGDRYNSKEFIDEERFLDEHFEELFPKGFKIEGHKLISYVFNDLTKEISKERYATFECSPVGFNATWKGRIPCIPGGELILSQNLDHAVNELKAELKYLEGTPDEDLDYFRKELMKYGLKKRK